MKLKLAWSMLADTFAKWNGSTAIRWRSFGVMRNRQIIWLRIVMDAFTSFDLSLKRLTCSVSQLSPVFCGTTRGVM